MIVDKPGVNMKGYQYINDTFDAVCKLENNNLRVKIIKSVLYTDTLTADFINECFVCLDNDECIINTLRRIFNKDSLISDPKDRIETIIELIENKRAKLRNNK